MDTIAVRQFCDGDEAALHAVFYSAVHEVASADYTSEQVHAWAPPELDIGAWSDRVRKNKPFVAIRNGEIAGFADLQNDGYVDQFFVSSRCPRSGVGSALMKHIERAATEKGLAQLTADVSRTAEPFFLRWGFEVVERRLPVRRGIALPNAFMRKQLTIDSTRDRDGAAAATR